MNVARPELLGALRGPIIMITIGVLFLLDRFTGLNFGETWPLILIVLGVLALMGAGSRRSVLPPDVPPVYPPNYPPNYPQNYPAGYSAPYGDVPPGGTPPNAPRPNAPPPGVRR